MGDDDMTAFNPERHHRRSIRLKGYDYAQAGAYFVTVCTHERRLLFDELAIRQLAEDCWLAIPDHAPGVELDEWVVMPNHVHGIIVQCGDIQGRDVQGRDVQGRDVQLNVPTARDPNNPFSIMSPRRNTLSVIIRTYKAAVTTACRRIGRDDFAWQRNYYEHIIRNERELNAIRQYIQNNPLKWALDRDNPTNWKGKSVCKGVQLNALTDADTVKMYLREAGL
jgi:REP element-mobilizing transposase RayT